MPTDIDSAKYVSFTTYRRDGSPVSTPVWVVPFEGGYAFTTDAGSHKVRRLANDARATLTVCDIRGRVKDGAIVHHGAAVVLDADATSRVAALVRTKYRFGWAMLGLMSAVRKATGRGSNDVAEAAIKVTLN